MSRKKATNLVNELNSAIYAFKHQNYSKAKKKFEIAVQFEEANKQAVVWGYYGITLAELKDLSGSLTAFTKATQLESSNSNFWMNRGIIEEKLELLPAARKSYEQAYRHSHEDVQIPLAIARIIHRTESPKKAIDFLKKALKNFPTSSELLLEISALYVKTGTINEAEDFLTEHLATAATASVGVALGFHFLKEKNYPYAENVFRKTFQRFPSVVEVHYGLALAKHAQNNLTGAIASYNDAANLDKPSVELLMNLARAYSQKGEVKKAIEVLYRSRKLDKPPIELTLFLTRLLLDIDRPEKAERILLGDMDSKAKNPQILFYLGLTKMQQQQLEDAKQYFQECLQHDSNFTDAQIQLSIIEAQEQEPGKAMDRIMGVIEKTPDHPFAIRIAGQLAFMQQKLDLVVKILEPFVLQHPDDSAMVKLLLQAWNYQGLDAKAHEFAASLLIKNASTGEIWREDPFLQGYL